MGQPARSAPQTLPPRPNLVHLKNEAKFRLKTLRKTSPAAKLAEVQLAVARDYGFRSWRSLKAYLEEEAAPDMPMDAVGRRRYEQSLPRKEVAIDPALLDGYVGAYQLASTAVFTVMRQEDQLFVKLTGQAPFPVFPESATKFFYKALHAQISFINDDQGHATALILHQNGHERRSPRATLQVAEDAAKTLVRRIKEKVAVAGSEAALQRQIEAVCKNDGEPDYSEMTSELAEISRPQVPAIKAQFDALGMLRSLAFLGVGQQGWDIYRVEFENSTEIFRIYINENGKVAGLLFQGGP